MAGGRIPTGINEFGNYMEKTNSYMQAGTPVTNGERVGLLPDETKQWKAFTDEWTPLFALYADITNGRTRGVRNNMMKIIDDVIKFDQTNHILDRIAASPNATLNDWGIFNINGGVLPKMTRSVPTTAIKEAVTVAFQALGGATVNVKCYSISGQRASILDGADCIQYLFQVGNTPPTGPNEDVLKLGISTKASFLITFNSDAPGKYLYMYFRWYNAKHPELAGPWSGLQSTMIL
jgi:hypothetical protein